MILPDLHSKRVGGSDFPFDAERGQLLDRATKSSSSVHSVITRIPTTTSDRNHVLANFRTFGCCFSHARKLTFFSNCQEKHGKHSTMRQWRFLPLVCRSFGCLFDVFTLSVSSADAVVCHVCKNAGRCVCACMRFTCDAC